MFHFSVQHPSICIFLSTIFRAASEQSNVIYRMRWTTTDPVSTPYPRHFRRCCRCLLRCFHCHCCRRCWGCCRYRSCSGCRSCRRFGGTGFWGGRLCHRLRGCRGLLNRSGIFVAASCSGGIASGNALPGISVCCIASGSSRCVSECCRIMVLFVCCKRILFCHLFHITCADPVFSVEPLDFSVKDADLGFFSACLSCASCSVVIRCHSLRHLIGGIFRPVSNPISSPPNR